MSEGAQVVSVFLLSWTCAPFDVCHFLHLHAVYYCLSSVEFFVESHVTVLWLCIHHTSIG